MGEDKVGVGIRRYGTSLPAWGLKSIRDKLIEPDTLLPEQYLETFRRKTPIEPEKRLILAVLEDAIACYQKYVYTTDNKGINLFRDAEEWILEEDSDRLFSFENICEVLGMDPGYIKKGLINWKEKALQEKNLKIKRGVELLV